MAREDSAPYERTVIYRVQNYFRRLDYATCREVPVLSSKVDLVATRTGTNELIAVEAKVKNWVRATQQAIFYRLCCHKVYVAIWHKNVGKVDRNVLNKFGIGLMSVDGNVRVVMKPRSSTSIHPSLETRVINYLHAKSG